MPKIIFRVELNKGRVGIPLSKLVSIVAETSQFLELLAEDIGLKSATWVAKDFDNNSVDFNCECLVEDFETERRGQSALRVVANNNRGDSIFANIIRPKTWRQFAEITKTIDDDEKVNIGIVNGSGSPEMFSISKERLIEENARRPKTAKYFGEIQGIVHAFYKEVDEPKFVIRELSSKRLVDCFFDKKNVEMYKHAVKLLEDQHGVVFVEGEVTESLDDGIAESVKVSDFRPAPTFDVEKFEKGIGAFPNITSGQSTERYIEEFREHGEKF